MTTRDDGSIPTGAGRSPGKIFIGGLSRKTTKVQFFKHFRKYGEIKDSVIMLDPRTGLPRGFGFVTYENPSVIDKIIEDTHVINGKQIDIRRTIPKGVVGTKDFKTRRIFVTGIPSRLSEDEFKDLFKQFGEVKEHWIVQGNNATNYFHGFGFITFDTEQAVDDVLAKGNKVEVVGGSQILLHKVSTGWEPPPRGFFKLNSDGSSAANPGEAGAGGIIRNDQGQWIVGYSRKLGQATSTYAELWGVRDGLQLAVKRGLFDIIIEVDSQVVLDLICKDVVDSHALGPIIKECRLLLKQIPNHRLCQINREINSCADHLARMGATMTKDFVVFELPPDCIKLLLFAESLEPEDNEVLLGLETNEFKPLHHIKDDKSLPHTEHGASPGKIFIGGLGRDITSAQFLEHFSKYGEIVDYVIMKKKETGQRRGFGFVTYADPSVVDKVIKHTHIINGKQVEIKRTILKGALGTEDFKTKRVFVGGIPSRVSEDEFKDFFSQFGEVNKYQVMQDHTTGGSCAFGYVTFDTEQAVDDLLAKGNKVELAGAQVEIKRMPKKQIPLPTLSKLQGDSGNAYDGFEDSYDGCDGDRFDNIGYRPSGSAPLWGGVSGHAGHDGVEFGGYRGYHNAMELYREEPFLEYSGHCGRGKFGLYEEYGSGMEPYRGEPSFQYSGHHGGCEFGQFKYHGGAMEPYRGEPSEYLRHVEGGQFGGYGGAMELYGQFKCHGGAMEPYRGEPSEYLRHVEGGQFGGYGGAMELYGQEPFHEYSSRSRGGFYRGYDVRHGNGSHSEIYGEYGADGIDHGGYRGGAGGSFLGNRGGEGGVRRGRWYHPYTR